MTLLKRKCMSNNLSFEYHTLLDHVFKLKMSLYGLKQAPRAWYNRLSFFLLENDFIRDKIDTTLFRREVSNDFIIVQIYVDAIIFGATNESLCKDFSDMMKSGFDGKTQVLSKTLDQARQQRYIYSSVEIH